jgi:glycosyltransferase involved in cell wall biosynthesis
MNTIAIRTRRCARLCMVVHAYYPIGEPRVQREARAASDSGYEVTVICLRGPSEVTHEQIDGVDVRRLPLRHVRGARLDRIAFEYMAFTVLATVMLASDAARRTYDVVHVHAPPDFLILAGLLPKLSGSRLLLDIHDLSAHLNSARFTGWFGASVSKSLTAIQRIACLIADHVVTVHEPYRMQLVNDGVDGGKVTVVMNSVDPSLLEDLADSASGGDSSPDRSFTLAYHGTLTHWYGVDLLLNAMVHLGDCLPDARALVLGDGDALQALQELATQSGLGKRVEFSGRYLSINETLAQVARTQCGVIPNRATTLNRFALSSKLFEYIALGIPVVVSRLETLAAHFRPDEVTFFEPDDVLSLAEAIRWVAEHPDEAAAKAQRASARAQEYGWDRNRARYLAVLSER